MGYTQNEVHILDKYTDKGLMVEYQNKAIKQANRRMISAVICILVSLLFVISAVVAMSSEPSLWLVRLVLELGGIIFVILVIKHAVGEIIASFRRIKELSSGRYRAVCMPITDIMSTFDIPVYNMEYNNQDYGVAYYTGDGACIGVEFKSKDDCIELIEYFSIKEKDTKKSVDDNSELLNYKFKGGNNNEQS